MMAGPAALAVQTGAALLPTTLWFDGAGWRARICDEVPVPETGTRKEKVAVMTQEVARDYEDGIRGHPQDWHMLQKIFVADLDPERLAAADRAARGESEPAGTAPAGTPPAGTSSAGTGPGGEPASAVSGDGAPASAAPGGDAGSGTDVGP